MIKAPESRLNNIDALRLILSVLVLFSHSFPLGTGTEQDEPFFWLSRGQVTLGGLAVDWFFVLSGFLISQSWERSRTVWSFLRKRIFRIYPGYLVAVALCIWAVVPLAAPGGSQVYSGATVVANLGPALALRGFVVPPTFVRNPAPGLVNGSLWSIPYEFWCYLGVVFLGVTTLLGRRWLITSLFLVSLMISFAFDFFQLNPGGKLLGWIFGFPPFWARLLPFYLAGMMTYQVRNRLRFDRQWALLALVGLALGMRIPHSLSLLLPSLGTYLVFYLAFTTDWRWHNAARYGDFSYGIYLYAFPIQQLVMLALGRPVHPLTLFGLALVPTILAGVLSWFLVERRFLLTSHPRQSPPMPTDHVSVEIKA